MRPWIAFFSQTGTEIHNLSNALGIYPDCVVTNKQDHTTTNECLIKTTQFRQHKLNLPNLWCQLSKSPTVEEYNNVLGMFTNPVITLHGYLRIIPKEICQKYEIYNLHPGPIKLHPELKGKDPQKAAFLLNHATVGCVLHKVISEVDAGEIIYSQSVFNDCKTLECVYQKCSTIAQDLWSSFFTSYLKLASQ